MLSHRIAVYIPSTVNGNEPAPADLIAKWVKSAKVKFSQLFGGFTAHRAVGGWMSLIHGLVEEPVTVVTSFTDDDGLDRLGEVEDFAAAVAEALGQEAVTLEIDNSLQFIGALAAAA
ncbi:MAG TPA: hypothetical protein VH592_10515 [Gemmataceae bacterium]|jgi:hypothetical protein